LAIGSSAKNSNIEFQNKMQFGFGFIDEQKTSIRLVCSGIIKQSRLGNFGFSKSNAICRPGNYMQFNANFISKTRRQCIVCDSRSNFGFSKLNANFRPRNDMQFNSYFMGKTNTSILCV
jgi:hypothetical protein